MLTLSVLRHAKSGWTKLGLDDFDRPLNGRGKAAAPLMGAYLTDSGIAPGLVLCSSAMRARQTLGLVLPELHGRPEIIFDDKLYLAAADTIIEVLQQRGGGNESILLIGHNPGLQSLVLELCSRAASGELACIGHKFPTCALAVITFKMRHWRNLKPATGQLAAHMTPARLDAA